ncbi:glycosyltransferase family protein [Acidocella facilis]|uniref:glycosyltransferase n=1 Tax=Acidocella facilis TaxID=525 RepID=UPI000479C6F3|nr:glycosyltransferase [Acidocella facilis]
MSEGGKKPAKGQALAPVPPDFDEQTYLRLNPDVLVAVAEGKFRSGREHYEHYGRAEGRLAFTPGGLPRDRVIITARPGQADAAPRVPAGAIDAVQLSASGGLYVIGWVNDALDRLDAIELYVAGWSMAFSAAGLARTRRPDAEKALGLQQPHAIGFWGFLYAGQRLMPGKCNLVMRLKSGAELAVIVSIEPMEDLALRGVVLQQLAGGHYPGPSYFNAVAAIEAGIGEQLVDFSRMLTRRAVSAPYIERFHQPGRALSGSVIVCLFGKPDYLILQQALLARQARAGAYEYIYVCNSPELAERLQKDARIAHLTHGLDITLILLPENAGFAAANNLAASHARTDRLLLLNPDVFPKAAGEMARHLELVASAPPAQTRLLGAALYYDDGALMHAGMYFEADRCPGFAMARREDLTLLRVEHYGKGAPAEDAALLRPRFVPAITGAFMSIARDWFETLDGFSEDYIFGHYEDADLCLRSLEAGQPAFQSDLRFYHLEGKGGARQGQHEGGAAVNRWLFNHRWGALAARALMGPSPSHEALQGDPA